MVKKIKLSIQGMTCQSCEQVIPWHFQKLGIKAQVSFLQKQGYFVYETSQWSDEDIINNIKILGYYASYYQKKPSRTTREYWEIVELSLAVIISILFFTYMISKGGLIKAPSFMGNAWIQFFLASFVQLYVGRRFYQRAFFQLKNKTFGMDFLVAFSTSLAYIYSTFFMFWGYSGGELFFGVSAEVITFLLIGRIIEQKIKDKANLQIKTILSSDVKEYTLVNGQSQKMLHLKKGDMVIIKSGQKIPAEAIITKGTTTVDLSSITGEAIPIEKKEGDKVISGTINGSQTIIIKLIKDAQESNLFLISQAIKKLQQTKSPIAKKVDQISHYFVPIVLIVIMGVLFYYLLWAQTSYQVAIYHVIAVAAVACPCALGMATPMATVAGFYRAFKNNILYNRGDVFEKFKKVSVIAFDKTGTITKGELFINKIIGDQSFINQFIDLEIISMHPIAKAFMSYKDFIVKNYSKTKFNNYQEIIGSGVKGDALGKRFMIGSWDFITSQCQIDNSLEISYQKLLQQGQVVVLGAVNNKVCTIFALSDQIKESSYKAILALQSQHVKTIMITGDNQVTANLVASKLKIDQVYAQVKPFAKKEIIANLQKQGHFVAFVGDGVNDAGALVQANLSIAMGSGSDITQKNADITILDSNLFSICQALFISQKTLRIIYENLIIAFGWNGIMIPLAAIGFLHPVLAAGLMILESILVVVNSQKIWLFKTKF